MNKSFDCVEMKHKGAELIYKKTAEFSREEELQFWKEKTISLKNQKNRLQKKTVLKTNG
jgi:hypothetical protein